MYQIIKKYQYRKLIADTSPTGYRVYKSPDGKSLASVTTVLSNTGDKSGLDNWRKRVGDARADAEVRDATNLGSLVHTHLENYILGIERPDGSNIIYKMALQISNVIIENGLINVDEVWGIEQNIYYPELYAGTMDLVGKHRGDACIMDFKTTKNPKKEEYVVDYFIQGTAYAMAHNKLYDTNINKVVLFMSSRDLQYQEWVIQGDEFERYAKMWCHRLEAFLSA